MSEPIRSCAPPASFLAEEMAELRSALIASHVTQSGEHDANVRRATSVVVDVLREAGWPVEAIIFHVKQVAAEVGSARTRARLTTDVVRWCKEHYTSPAS